MNYKFYFPKRFHPPSILCFGDVDHLGYQHIITFSCYDKSRFRGVSSSSIVVIIARALVVIILVLKRKHRVDAVFQCVCPKVGLYLCLDTNL